MPRRLFLLPFVLTLSCAHALPDFPGDPAALAMAGAGAALVGDYRPRRNPASGALYTGREDVQFRVEWGPGERSTWQGGDVVSDGRLLGGELGLPRLPLALGAFTQARFQRIQGVEAGSLITRELWRVESGADVARLLVDQAGRGRRLGIGFTAKLVSLRPRAARGTVDTVHPALQQTHAARLDLDVGLLGSHAFRWRWALVGRDLFARATPWPDGEGGFGGRLWRAAVAYQGPRWSLAADLDLNAIHRGMAGRVRRLALGVAWRGPVTVRAGVAPDLLGKAAPRWGMGGSLRWHGLSVEGGWQKSGPGRGITVLGLGWSF